MKNICVIYTDNTHITNDKPMYVEKICFKPMIEYCIETAGLLTGFKPYIITASFDILSKYNTIAQLVDNFSFIPNIEDFDNLILINSCSPLIDTKIVEFGISYLKNNNLKAVAIGDGLYVIKPEYLDNVGDVASIMKVINDDCQEKILETIVCKNYLDLAYVDRVMRLKINHNYIKNNVKIVDPYNTYIQKNVSIGENTIIYPGTIIEGETIIGSNCEIYSECNINNSIIGNNVTIRNSTIMESSIGNFSTIGPYAYIRPGSKIGENVKIGDFCEVKKSIIGNETKISHLTYVGDAKVGKNVNFGCGTVIVNYDGQNKHLAEIEDEVFIGCNVNLISPIKIGKKAFIAAGSTITDDVPDNGFAIARQRQINKKEWVRPKDRQK